MKKEYLDRQSYSTDLTDEQWKAIEPLFVGLREYKYSKRELLNALLYLVKTGCQWRNLPHDFPPYSTISRGNKKFSINRRYFFQYIFR